MNGKMNKWHGTWHSGCTIVQPTNTVTQTVAAPKDGGPCGFNSKCIVMQMTTCCHKTRCRSCVVAVGSANGPEGRACEWWHAHGKAGSVWEGFGGARRRKAPRTRLDSTILYCVSDLWTGEIVTHIWIGTSSRRFRSMVKQDRLISWLLKWSALVLRNCWLDFSQRIGGMWMNPYSLHLLHQIMGSHRGRWAESEQISSRSRSPSRATQMALRRKIYSSLGSQRSLDALVNKAWSCVGFITTQIKQLGWQGRSLKSEIINSNVSFSH